MATYVALLRGINVGKARRLPMADLRALLTGLGYFGVATLLNSGNAVFSAPKGTPARLAGRIEAAIQERFGFEVTVIVRSAAELAAIVAENPLAVDEADYPRFLVGFVQEPASLPALGAIGWKLGRQAAYLHCPEGLLDNPVAKATVGKPSLLVTTRNWATVLKLQALAGSTRTDK